jgi:hypothetical protein
MQNFGRYDRSSGGWGACFWRRNERPVKIRFDIWRRGVCSGNMQGDVWRQSGGSYQIYRDICIHDIRICRPSEDIWINAGMRVKMAFGRSKTVRDRPGRPSGCSRRGTGYRGRRGHSGRRRGRSGRGRAGGGALPGEVGRRSEKEWERTAAKYNRNRPSIKKYDYLCK